MKKIKDQEIKIEASKVSKVSNEFTREFIKIDKNTIERLIFVNDIKDLEGLNRKAKADSVVRRDVVRLAEDPSYFLKERRPILVNRRNLHIIDGQHTTLAVKLFIEKFPEQAEKFECYLELWDIETIEEEEKLIRELNISRNWKGIDFFIQGLNSSILSKRENYKRFYEVMKELEKAFPKRFSFTKLLTTSANVSGVSNINCCVKETDGMRLSFSEGDKIDSIQKIKLAEAIEKAARGPHKINGKMGPANTNFTLDNPKAWIVINRLDRLNSFDKDAFIKYIAANYSTLEWWGGNKAIDMANIQNSFLDVAYAAGAIDKIDYLNNLKRQ